MYAEPFNSSNQTLTVWCIYRHPAPHPYVVIPWCVKAGEPSPVPGPEGVACATLADARAAVPPGLTLLMPDSTDDPNLVEQWL